MDWKPHSIVLLTGAGFTHNFGGYLADQMWEKILNQPESYASQSLRMRLLNDRNLDFEEIYSTLRHLNESEYKEFLKSLNRTYVELDKEVQKNAQNPSECNIDLNELSIWFHRFLPTDKLKRGFIFSLNQDLLFERLKHNTVPHMPGVGSDLQCGKVAEKGEIVKVRLPGIISYEEICAQLLSLNLIKLHGSCNWLSSDGTDAIVVGKTKTDQIEREPVLRHFIAIFRKVLNAPNIQLWCIGYGFKDSHINEILVKAINESGLRLCIINPQLPKSFFDKLNDNTFPYGNELKKGISGYVSNSLSGIFQRNKPRSGPLQSIDKLMACVQA